MENSEQRIEKRGMEEMSTSSMNNNNPSNEIGSPPNKKAKKRINFHGFLPDCLDWFKRPELAQSPLNTASYALHQHCYRKLHGKKVKPHTVRKLVFTRRDGQTILEKDGTVIPIAEVNPPDFIHGFEEIIFCCFDDQVLRFVRKILSLLKKKEVALNFNYELFGIGTNNWGPIKNLMKLLAPKTNKLNFWEENPLIFSTNFHNFDCQFPNFIFGLQSIHIFMHWGNHIGLLVEWLTTPMEDYKQKMLEIRFASNGYTQELISDIKEEFVDSTVPANFIVLAHYNEDNIMDDLDDEEEEQPEFEDFKIENKETGEVLELQRKVDKDYLLIRRKNDGKPTPKIDELEDQFVYGKTTIWIVGRL